MYKAYKFRIYPNKSQLTTIDKTLESSRLIYNYYLDKSLKDKKLNIYNCIKDYITNLRNKYPFLQKIPISIIENTLFNMEKSLKKYNNNITSAPRFKSRYKRNTYTIPALYNISNNKVTSNINIDLINKRINIPNINNLKIRSYNKIHNIYGKIKSITISKEPTNKYYISVLYEIYNPKIITPSSIVGIDLGIKNLLTLSTGKTYSNNKYISIYEKRIKRKQQQLQRKTPYSNNYYKCKQQLIKLYSKLVNARKHYINLITSEITNDYDIIICETINSINMIQKGTENDLSKKLNDATFNEIIRELSYKSMYKGKIFIQIPKYYRSTQICSMCNNIDNSYKDLTKREYHCNNCNLSLDRDLNASLNILDKGIYLYLKKLQNK